MAGLMAKHCNATLDQTIFLSEPSSTFLFRGVRMIKGMALSKGGSRLPLILGLILGLVAAVLVVVYLTSAKDEGGSTSSGEGVPVVVASQNVEAGVRLTPGMLAVKSIPQSDQLA